MAKRTAALFIGAIASFFFLSYIDEFDVFMLPLLKKGPPSAGFHDMVKEGDVEVAIRDFNDTVAKAYLSSDPLLLNSEVVDYDIRSSIAQDIDYLTREGKVMELRLRGMEIEKVEIISPRLARVNTREILGLRYLSMVGKGTIEYPDSMYDMVYTLSRMNGKWKVVSYETVGTKERKP